MKYLISPEFHRNLWLKFTPFKLVAAPVTIALLVFIQQKLGMEGTNLVFIVMVFLWGNYEAGTAMQEEINSKTWDLQRMSSITPVQLAFGKLFGVTAYTWYFGLMGLIASAVFFNVDIYTCISLVLAGVFGQSLAFLSGLCSSFVSTKEKKSGGIGSTITGVIASFFTGAKFVPHYGAGFSSQMLGQTAVQWYKIPIGYDVFLFASVLFFLVWALIGIYRITKAELMYRSNPAVWAVFVTSASIYIAGLASTNVILSLYAIVLGATFLTMLYEPFDIRKFQRLFLHWRKGDYKRGFENMPLWTATVPIAFWFYLAAVGYSVALHPQNFLGSLSLCTSIFLFAIRDCVMMHIINIRSKIAQQRFQKIFYFLMVYGLIPFTYLLIRHSDVTYNIDSVLSFTQEGTVATAESLVIASLFPSAFSDLVTSLLPVTIQTCLLALWLRRLYRISQKTIA